MTTLAGSRSVIDPTATLSAARGLVGTLLGVALIATILALSGSLEVRDLWSPTGGGRA
jgi:hypothetical protein